MTDIDRTFQMSVKTTSYILLVVCSFKSNMKRECVLEIGLVCCFIPIHISQVGVTASIPESLSGDKVSTTLPATSRIYCKVN